MGFGILGVYQTVSLMLCSADDYVHFLPEDKHLKHVPGTVLLSELAIIGGHEVGAIQKGDEE
jgi:hypothetical protein